MATAREQGLPDVVASNWFAAFYPKGTPAAVVEKLNGTINHILDSAEFKSTLLLLGAQPVTMSPIEWAGAIRVDLKRWERVVRQAQMTE